LELGALVMCDKGCTAVQCYCNNLDLGTHALRRVREERRNTEENSYHNEEKLKFMTFKCTFNYIILTTTIE
jgi:hypothetical protein